MVEIKDIVDRESLEAWLKTRPRADMVAIANRSVLRLLPKYWYILIVENMVEDPDFMLMRFLRMGFLSYIGSNKNAALIGATLKRVSEQSYYDATDYYQLSDPAEIEDLIFDSSYIAVSAIFSKYPLSATSDAVICANEAASHDGWLIVRADCEKLEKGFSLHNVPLFHSKEVTGDTVWRDVVREIEVWNDVTNQVYHGNLDWSFWIKWYEASLNGEPLDYRLLGGIALIPSDDWEQGPAHINALVAKIEAEFEEKAPEIQTSPTQMLDHNRTVIEMQLDVLVKLVSDEILLIRGRNDVSKAEGELIQARVSALESILDAVEKINAALSGESASTALTVIEEQLPEVFEGAERLEALRPEDVLSGSIIGIGVAVKYLTECGMSSTVATTVAVSNMVTKKISGLFSSKKK